MRENNDLLFGRGLVGQKVNETETGDELKYRCYSPLSVLD